MITKFQSEVNKFIWSDSHPRISKTVLYKSQKNGGLGFPDFWLYYLSARWSQLAQWHIQNSKISWVNFENNSILPYSIAGLLWGLKIPTHKLANLNIVVANSYQLWKLHNKKFNMVSITPPRASFIGDPKFLQVHQDSEHFSWWTKNNLTTLKSLMIDSTFTSFAALKEKYKTPNGEFRKFLQIRHFYTTYF